MTSSAMLSAKMESIATLNFDSPVVSISEIEHLHYMYEVRTIAGDLGFFLVIRLLFLSVFLSFPLPCSSIETDLLGKV